MEYIIFVITILVVIFFIPVGKLFDVRNPFESFQRIWWFYSNMFKPGIFSQRIHTTWLPKYVWIYDELIKVAIELEDIYREQDKTGNKTISTSTNQTIIINLNEKSMC